ncbi:hypothetical protein [Saccharothrix syringae]|uniref:Uncharacterized protein n=1 Tax=Saccharothrix syringae TaxID=103733 RepID=A0A5Q0H3D1_SACSY|nr:hypothetical protein [Saccharothrix syringae]QFZ20320.1 hypothetical protein EKG83_25455 [Saccharothrix syringae]
MVVRAYRVSSVDAAVPWILVGLALAVVEAAAVLLGVAVFPMRHVVEPVVVGAAGGLWIAFVAVVVGRRAASPRPAVAGAVGLLVEAGAFLGLAAILLHVLPGFLIVYPAQALLVVAVAATASLSGPPSWRASVWAGLSAGLLGGVVSMLRGIGGTGSEVLVIGALLVVVAVVLLVRRPRHALMAVPVAAVVAFAVAPVYALVPAAVTALFPVVAG